MRSQKLATHFEHPIGIESTEMDDILGYHHPAHIFTRDTYQIMSPLLFESDTEDTSQSTDIKCYQDKTITPLLQIPATPNDLQIFDVQPTINDLRNEYSSRLMDTSSQHNQCCSESLLDSSNHKTIIETKKNTNDHNTYISPSPRVTRSKLLNSRILTRSAKRLHKISECSEYSESPRNAKKARLKKDLSKDKKRSSDGKSSKSTASDKEKNERLLLESIRNTKVRVVLEKLKFPFFQNPHRFNGKFIQPNIVPNIQVDVAINDRDFLNRRLSSLSSDVQMLTERPAVISISSESTIRNEPTSSRRSPDLFESSSLSTNQCSQNSIGIPNGQILMSDADHRISETATSTPNNPNDSTLVPSIFDLFDQDCVATPDIKLLLEENNKKSNQQQHTFEITVNEVFDNVICVADSEETLTPPKANPISECRTVIQNNEQESAVTSDNLDNLIDLTKCSSSQEITPKKRPEIHGLLNRSLGACPSNGSPTLNRSKWLSKPKSSNSDGDLLNRPSPQQQRCRRLDLWFQNDRDKKPRKKGNVDRKRKFSNNLLTSSEEEDS